MKRLAVVLFALTLWVCPAMLHASPRHVKPRAATRHHVVGHPRTRHYTQRAQRHAVVRPVRVRHYTHKAHVDKAARHAHRKHRKIGHR